MATISITDLVHPSASVTINDTAPLAESKLTQLSFASIPVVGDLVKPIDQCSFREAHAGATVSSPSLLLASPVGLSVSAGENATLLVRAGKDRQLFDPEDITPDVILIGPGQCWVGLELATTVAGSLSATMDGVGVSATDSKEVAFGTDVLFTANGGPLPTLLQALKTLLEEFAVGATAAAVRNQRVNTVRTMSRKGTVQVAASYTLPMSINPLASAALPFQYQLTVQPATTIQVSGSITLTGEFSTRANRSSENTLVFGLYKKKETTFSASFIAGAGVSADVNGSDLLSPVLNAVFGAPNVAVMQLDDRDSVALKDALKSSVGQSFSVAMNACCSASVADEAALVYSIDLTRNVNETNQAIASALRGDWSAFAGLANAKEIRNIVREIKDRNHRISFNLLGVFNATSIHDYLQSSTVLHDGNGQIVLVSKSEASNLSATDTPYAAKPDRLRAALSQDFVATISYGAAGGSAKGKLALKSFTVGQTYLDFNLKPGAPDLRAYILLGRALGISIDNRWDALVQSNTKLGRAKCYIDVQYGVEQVMHIFYADPVRRVARTQAELDKIGRDTKIALLDQKSDTGAARAMALSSPDIWNAMADCGVPTKFHLIDGLSGLPDAAVGAISADYIDVRWWSDAMLHIPAKLTAVLKALDASTTANPLLDQTFMARQKELQAVLSGVLAKTRSAFDDGWGLAVIHACAEGTGWAQMDLSCGSQVAHYEGGSPVAAVASG
jgi:hypothetical protein